MLSRGGQEVRREVDEHGMDAKQFTIGERVILSSPKDREQMERLAAEVIPQLS